MHPRSLKVNYRTRRRKMKVHYMILNFQTMN